MLASAARRQTDNQAWDPAESQLTKRGISLFSGVANYQITKPRTEFKYFETKSARMEINNETKRI